MRKQVWSVSWLSLVTTYDSSLGLWWSWLFAF